MEPIVLFLIGYVLGLAGYLGYEWLDYRRRTKEWDKPQDIGNFGTGVSFQRGIWSQK